MKDWLDDDFPMFEKTRYLRRGMKSRHHKKLLPRCTGKATYPTKRAAQFLARHILRTRGVTVYVYHCPKPACTKWHITHKRQYK